MKKTLAALSLAVFLTACATAPQMAAPSSIQAPTPIVGNAGKFMSPYTEDGTVAKWVEKGRSASAGASVGGFVGAQVGSRLAENIPFVGGFIGQQVGQAAGRSVALSMVGGEAYIKETSDLSFNSVEDLAVYMYAKNSSHKDYPKVLELTQAIYPDLARAYYPAIAKASSRKR
jgi:hypothetical protein